MTNRTIFFAPQLTIPNGVKDISFYIKAFDAVELRRFMNDDGTYHVSELSIAGNIFHLHEEVKRSNQLCPGTVNSTTVLVGLFVPDVDAVIAKAIAAGAELISPAQDYDYGYRQGDIRDPFGHHWMIEKKI
ncbi:MAG: VOC family protein [Ferruginibacter sp.]